MFFWMTLRVALLLVVCGLDLGTNFIPCIFSGFASCGSLCEENPPEAINVAVSNFDFKLNLKFGLPSTTSSLSF